MPDTMSVHISKDLWGQILVASSKHLKHLQQSGRDNNIRDVTKKAFICLSHRVAYACQGTCCAHVFPGAGASSVGLSPTGAFCPMILVVPFQGKPIGND